MQSNIKEKNAHGDMTSRRAESPPPRRHHYRTNLVSLALIGRLHDDRLLAAHADDMEHVTSVVAVDNLGHNALLVEVDHQTARNLSQ